MDVSVSAFPAASSDGGRVGLDVGQLFRTLRRHVILIIALAVTTAAIAFFYARSLPRTYTATTSIAVEGDRFDIPELQGALRSGNSTDPMPFVRTELQAITSPTLVQEVIDQLRLAELPEFNPRLRSPGLSEYLFVQLQRLLPKGSGPIATATGEREAVLNAVSKALSSFQDNRSLVIALAFTSQDPDLSAQVLNTLEDDFLAARAQRRATADRAATEVLDQRITQETSDLDKLGQQMAEMRKQNDLVGLRAGSVGQQQVEDLVTTTERASAERAQLEANLARADAAAKRGSLDALSSVLDSNTTSRLRQQEADAAARVANLSARFGPTYPELSSANANLAAVQHQLASEARRIVASLSSQLQAARDKEAQLRFQLAAAQSNAVRAQNSRAQLDQLQSQIDMRRALYQTLMQRKQQTMAVPLESTPPGIRVLSRAVPLGEPTGPNGKLITGVGGLSGALLGCILALIRLQAVNGFEDAAEVERRLGLPVLATLPQRMLRPGIAARARAGTSAEAGALREIRERTLFVSGRGVPRIVLITPALSHTGVAEFAAAFAEAAAAAGDRVLLIEAELGRPALARTCTGVVSAELGAVVRGDADWRALFDALPREGGLAALFADKPFTGVVELLSGTRFQNLLIEARQYFDLVVMAGPDADSSKAAALAARADLSMILINREDGYPRAIASLQRLFASPASALSAVLVK